MQHDFFSFPGVETVHRLSRLHPQSQREVRAIERLKSWDGRLDARHDRRHDLPRVHGRVRASESSARPSTTDVLVERYLNKSGLELFAVVSSPWRFQARLLELWDEGDPAWFASAARPEGVPWDEVALEALEAALDGLEERFGRDPDRWRWGRVHGVEFSHPFGQANPLFRRIFNRFVEAGGASETVTQNGYLADRAVQGRLGAGLPDARRPRRPSPLALAAHHRPVRPPRLAATTTT